MYRARPFAMVVTPAVGILTGAEEVVAALGLDVVEVPVPEPVPAGVDAGFDAIALLFHKLIRFGAPQY